METTPRDYSYYNTIMSYYYSNMNNNLMTYSKNIYKIYPEIGITSHVNNTSNEVDLDTDEIFNDSGYDVTLYQNSYNNNETEIRVENYNYNDNDIESDVQTEMMDDLDDDDLSTILDDFLDDFHDLDLENFDFNNGFDLQTTQNLYE